MTSQHQTTEQDRTEIDIETESPDNLPVSAWVTLVGFAAFLVLFGTCAATWMFN